MHFVGAFVIGDGARYRLDLGGTDKEGTAYAGFGQA